MTTTSTVISTINAVGETILVAALCLFPLELWRRWNRRQLTKSAVLEMLASASPFLLVTLSATIATLFVVRLWTFASTLSPWQIQTTPLSAVAAFLLVDFLYYIDHRAGHRIRFYWAIAHSVHHSSPQFDQSTGFRVSFVDSFISPVFYLPALLIGFDVLLIASVFGFILLYQQWLHTELVGQLRWMDPWLNTPSNHRVHHGSQHVYLDKNYGAVLMIWDRMFGSYQAELDSVPVKFGLTEELASSNPIAVHTAEISRTWKQLAQTWRRTKNANKPRFARLGQAIRYLASPPSVPIDSVFTESRSTESTT
jgi:sterol desaturase/sphingolipid hydroxylase (fatty acid hydroxylase superfamily)